MLAILQAMTATDSRRADTDEAHWQALMTSAQAGCEADYRQLLTELSEAIKYYLLSRIGPQHFVEDCVQESLIAIHQARHTYDPHRRFRPWLFAIVRHKAIDALRRQQSQQQFSQRQRDDTLDSEQIDQPLTELDSDMNGARLLNRLSPQHREALTLTKLLGLSNAEAAARLHISESAVKVRVHRAIASLTRLMEADT